MQFVDFEAGCKATELKIAQTQMPTPAAHEVLVKVSAFGINRADTLQRQGKYPPPKGESEILGLEVAGEIVELGNDVTNWAANDRVCGLVSGGGYAEYVCIDAQQLIAIPDGMNDTQAAGIPEVFLTAYQSVFLLGNLRQGENLLVHAGASGVGLAAIQLGKYSGANVAVTASTDKKLEVCKEAGADVLINYKQTDYAEELKSQAWNADVVIDFVGGDYLNRNLSVLAQDGRIVYLAMLQGRFADKLDMARLLAKRASIIGSTLRNRDQNYKRELVAGFMQSFYPAFTEDKLGANIDSVFAVKDVGKAHEKLEANDSHGKLICTW